MSTTLKITKDMILDTAFSIARKSGIEKVSNREIAKRLNCSIRPIYYQFKNVKELNSELLKKIDDYFYKYLFENINQDIPKYKQVGINYIKFASCEKELFKILFMSEFDLAVSDFVKGNSYGYQNILTFIKESNGVSTDVSSFHVKMWIFAHGIASLVATNTIHLTDDEISNLLSSEFQALMLLEENPDNKWKIIPKNSY